MDSFYKSTKVFIMCNEEIKEALISPYKIAGHFGKVYKGQLSDVNDRHSTMTVAVKTLQG